MVVNQLTFGNDMGAPGSGNGIIECGAPCEYITYKLTDGASNDPADIDPCTPANDPCTLRRVNTDDSNESGDPVVEDVAAGGLTFTFGERRHRSRL